MRADLLIHCIYDIYKTDWLYSHISSQMAKDNIANYYEMMDADFLSPEEYSYEDYVNEFGFNYESYVSYEEFMENEYQNKEYINELLKDYPQLLEEYNKE